MQFFSYSLNSDQFQQHLSNLSPKCQFRSFLRSETWQSTKRTVIEDLSYPSISCQLPRIRTSFFKKYSESHIRGNVKYHANTLCCWCNRYSKYLSVFYSSMSSIVADIQFLVKSYLSSLIVSVLFSSTTGWAEMSRLASVYLKMHCFIRVEMEFIRSITKVFPISETVYLYDPFSVQNTPLS